MNFLGHPTYKNGQIQHDIFGRTFYESGKVKTAWNGNEYYENGNLKKSDKNEYYENGRLWYDGKTEYYDNGNVKTYVEKGNIGAGVYHYEKSGVIWKKVETFMANSPNFFVTTTTMYYPNGSVKSKSSETLNTYSITQYDESGNEIKPDVPNISKPETV